MKSVRRAGFTLIELLTVIAIIAILAGLTAVTLPGVLERAKIADVVTDMKAISQSLHAYYTEQGTYPPGYGYQTFLPNALAGAPPFYWHHSYTSDIGITGALDQYDRFSRGYDTNRNGTLQLLEFVPLPDDRGPGISWLDLEQTPNVQPYAGGEAVGALDKRLREQRPYVYVPYKKSDVDRMKRIAGEGWDGATWNAGFITANTVCPPPQFDSFVLLSVGPLENTRGVVSPPGDEAAWLGSTGETLPERSYYVLGMRAAYLATRDADKEGNLDFDYISRRNNGQAKAHPTMPDGRNDLGYAAPIIGTSQ